MERNFQLIFGGKLWFMHKTFVTTEFPIPIPDDVNPLRVEQFTPNYEVITSITTHPDKDGFALVNNKIEVPIVESLMSTAKAKKFYDNESECYEAAVILNQQEKERLRLVIDHYNSCFAALGELVSELKAHK